MLNVFWDDASLLASLRSVKVTLPISILSSSISADSCPSYNHNSPSANECRVVRRKTRKDLTAMLTVVGARDFVHGHSFGSTNTLVPEQETPLDLDLECFMIGERWPTDDEYHVESVDEVG